DASADVEAADADGNARGAEGPGDIHGAGKLIGLNPHQANQPVTSALAYLLDDFVWLNAGVGFIPGDDPNFNVFTQHAALGAILRKAVQRRQCVSRDGGA